MNQQNQIDSTKLKYHLMLFYEIYIDKYLTIRWSKFHNSHTLSAAFKKYYIFSVNTFPSYLYTISFIDDDIQFILNMRRAERKETRETNLLSYLTSKNSSIINYLVHSFLFLTAKILQIPKCLLNKSNTYLLLSILLLTFTSVYRHRQSALRATKNLEKFIQTVQFNVRQELYSLELIKSVPQDEETVKLSVPDIIDSYEEYSCEIHSVTTSDGYILELHRIVHKLSIKAEKSVPVILQHGLLADSSNWVLNGGDRNSLGFALAEVGKDVWLANSQDGLERMNKTSKICQMI